VPASELHDQRPFDFEDVYGEFHTKIRRYLERLVGPAAADDVTQDVFAKVSQALPQFRGESSLSTWIYRIATNAAYDRQRSDAPRRTRNVPIQEARVEDHAPGGERRMIRLEMTGCIAAYVARLPASHRSVLVLSEHEGLTNQEIADALGVTVDTVKIRLHRARARLRKELGSGCELYRDERNELACQPRTQGVSLQARPPSTRSSRRSQP
jgi:RNA polymerase sigma-70 factor, ECF subfamily